MSTQAPYIPLGQEAARTWMVNFRDTVTGDLSGYGLEAADGTQITDDVTAFSNALDVALDPNTRTPVAVANKDAARAQAEATVRTYAQLIKAQPGISNAMLEAAGINIDDESPTPIVAPASHPVITIQQQNPGSHVLRWSDSSTPNTNRSKPFGVTHCVLYRAFFDVGEPTPPLADAGFVGIFGREPMTVDVPGSEVGRRVVYYARWAVQSGDLSPAGDGAVGTAT